MDASQRRGSLDTYFAIFRRRKWVLLTATVVTLAGTLLFSHYQTPIYTSEARILVKAFPGLATTTSTSVGSVNLETESEVVSSVPVARRVERSLQSGESPLDLLGSLKVAPVTQQTTSTDVLDVTYSSTDPEFARRAAQQFSREYISFRRDRARHDLLIVQKSIEGHVRRVQAELAQLATQERKAQRAHDTGSITILEGQKNIDLARLGVLEQRLQDVQPDRTVALGGGEIIQPAALPLTPTSPNYRVNLTLGLMLGLMLGAGLTLLLNRFDQRFRGRDDLEAELGIPVLGTVPKFDEKMTRAKYRGARPPIIVDIDKSGAATEAYRSLRTAIQFSAASQDIRTLLFTSPSASEGKTTTVANLATALSHAGKKTVVVSADLRKSTIEKYFSAPSTPGLTDVLLNPEECAISDVLWETENNNLSLLPSGSFSYSPGELFTSPLIPSIIQQLEDRFEYVLIDSSPLLAVADAQMLAQHVDGTVLVINAGSTRISAAAQAKNEIERVGGRVIGAILNSVKAGSTNYYQYTSDYQQSPTNGQSNGETESARRSLST